ncbi:aspartate aminotransferase [Colletotrichum incanum]|uniref:Aspartate aminotransferase n=1 Tax=Colletotrichum incanum TaxID=1573173 RepID=A0A167CWP9_COLIC|nr:aspartate aminotransferase [Colletotrichum incanum]
MTSNSHIIKPSLRALANLDSGAFIDLENEASKLPQYDSDTRPEGLIDLSGAVNGLMDDVLAEEMEKFSRSYDLQQELCKAVSSFVNRYFKPAGSVRAEDVLITNGVTSLIDLMAFGMCDPGEGIMILTPTYMMFPHDLCARAGVRLIKVNPEPMDSQFDSRSTPHLTRALPEAYVTARKDGIIPRAFLLCNPSNPCGRTYPHSILVEIAKFCGQNSMHLLSDEIYAMSTFDTSTEKNEALDPFTSVLSIRDDPARGVFTENIHCIYGASKDFGCGGLRLGFLVTRNKLL